MKNKFFFACLVCGSTWLSVLYGQQNQPFKNAYSKSMGQILSVIPGIPNPSYSSLESKRYIELSYTDRFNLKELATLSALFQYPTPWMVGSIYLSRYGFDAYNETRASFTVSRLLTDKWSMGIRINYDQLHYSEKNPDYGMLSADIGITIMPCEKNIKIGIVWYNPLKTKTEIGESDLKTDLPVGWLLGVSYSLLDFPILAAAEIAKEESSPFQFKVGLEYQPFPILFLRGGLQNSPFAPGFGLGVRFSSFEIKGAFSHYNDLGIESTLSMIYLF